LTLFFNVPALFVQAKISSKHCLVPNVAHEALLGGSIPASSKFSEDQLTHDVQLCKKCLDTPSPGKSGLIATRCLTADDERRR
jgi:hypothetical protein